MQADKWSQKNFKINTPKIWHHKNEYNTLASPIKLIKQINKWLTLKQSHNEDLIIKQWNISDKVKWLKFDTADHSMKLMIK